MRIARMLCALAIMLGTAAGSADGQVWKRAAEERRPAASDGRGREASPGQARKGGPERARQRYRAEQGARVLREMLARRGYAVVRSSSRGDVRYVYYRARDGAVRRAAVRQGRDRLIFLDVPRQVLRDVLARLY